MKYEKIINNYELIYKIDDKNIICNVRDNESGKVYKFNLNIKKSREIELKNNNLKILYVLKYLYEDNSIRFKKVPNINKNDENFKYVELLNDIFPTDWIGESVLLKENLKLFNNVKIGASIEGYSHEHSTVDIKFVMKYLGKQYTFYRKGVLENNANLSVDKEYLKVLNDLKDTLIGKRKEDELFKRYNNLLLMHMGVYIQLGILDSIKSLNKRR